jgi:hypothetical protein
MAESQLTIIPILRALPVKSLITMSDPSALRSLAIELSATPRAGGIDSHPAPPSSAVKLPKPFP